MVIQSYWLVHTKNTWPDGKLLCSLQSTDGRPLSIIDPVALISIPAEDGLCAILKAHQKKKGGGGGLRRANSIETFSKGTTNYTDQ